MDNTSSNIVEKNKKEKRRKKPLVIIAYVLFWISLTLFILSILFTIERRDAIHGAYGYMCLWLIRIFFIILPMILTLCIISVSSSYQRLWNDLSSSFSAYNSSGSIYVDYHDLLMFISTFVIVLSVISLTILLIDIRKNNEKITRKEYVFSLLSIVFIAFFFVFIAEEIDNVLNPIIYEEVIKI